MRKNLLILLIIFTLLFQVSFGARKFKKGGGFSSKSRDSDGFGSFGNYKRKDNDNDGFFKRSTSNDDSIFKSKGFRRTNLYAGKKIEKFGDNFGKGIGGFFLRLFGVSSEEAIVVSGKRVKTSISIQASNHDLTYDWYSNTIIGVSVLLCILVIFCIIKFKPFAQSQDDKMIRKAKNKYSETYKNYQILKYIEENGVHPDRATGQIYKIRL